MCVNKTEWPSTLYVSPYLCFFFSFSSFCPAPSFLRGCVYTRTYLYMDSTYVVCAPCNVYVFLPSFRNYPNLPPPPPEGMIKVFFTISVELEQLGEDGMTPIRSEVFAFRGQALDIRLFLEVEEGDTLRNRVALTLGDMERNLDEFLCQAPAGSSHSLSS